MKGCPSTPGQLLVTLETETIDRQLSEQRAAIAAANAALAKAIAGPRSEEIAKAAAINSDDEIERDRLDRLYHYGIVAKEMADDAAAKAKTSAERSPHPAERNAQRRHRRRSRGGRKGSNAGSTR